MQHPGPDFTTRPGGSRRLPGPTAAATPSCHTSPRNNAGARRQPLLPAGKRRCPPPHDMTGTTRNPGGPSSPRTRPGIEVAAPPRPLTGNEWSGRAGRTMRRQPRALCGDGPGPPPAAAAATASPSAGRLPGLQCGHRPSPAAPRPTAAATTAGHLLHPSRSACQPGPGPTTLQGPHPVRRLNPLRRPARPAPTPLGGRLPPLRAAASPLPAGLPAGALTCRLRGGGGGVKRRAKGARGAASGWAC